MRYFIGFAIQEEAGKWHTALAKDISEKFDTWKIHEYIPSHITLYRPFNMDDVSPIKDLLRAWIQKYSVSGTLTLSGFDRFADRVVFAAVDMEKSTEDAIADIRQKIMAVLPKEDFPNFVPHATLADNDVSPEKIEKIWEYVNTLPKPHFVVPFDNITLFRKEGEKGWVVDEVFPVNGYAQ